VTEIKTLYGRRREEKLQIQKDMIALRDEHGWTQQRIADATDIPQRTVSNWLEAYDEALSNLAEPSRLTPESVQAASDLRVARRVLASAPLEQVEEMVRRLPYERRDEVGRAFDNTTSRIAADFRDRQRNLTPAQRAEREAAGEVLTSRVDRALAPFKAMSVANELDLATESLKELIADQSLTPEMIESIEKSLAEFLTELEVAKAMAGLEVGT
jgi:plasmid maintenance system antidote protein VapI